MRNIMMKSPSKDNEGKKVSGRNKLYEKKFTIEDGYNGGNTSSGYEDQSLKNSL